MKHLARYINKISKNVVIFSTPAALLLGADPAKAILNINIFDEGPNLKVVTSGSLSELGTSALGTSAGLANCGFNGAVSSTYGFICTGSDAISTEYSLSGPSTIDGSANLFPADSVSGLSFFLLSFAGIYSIDPSYTAGQPFLSSATFNNTNLAAQGFTTPGLAATWTIYGTSESINLIIGAPAEVPGPLPLLGAGAAFGWTRRLRRRISAPWITPPQA